MREKNRAQLKHSLRDVGMWNKPKLKMFRMKFGYLARVWYDDMIDAISGATNATVDIEYALGLASEIGITNGEELLSYSLEKGLLLTESPGTVSQQRVIEDQEKLFEQQEKWRKKKRTSGVPESDSQETPRGNSGETPESLNVQGSEDLNTELLKTEDLKNEDHKKKAVEKLLVGKYTKITSDEHQKFLNTWGPDETAYWLATFDLAYEQNPAKFCKQYSNHAAAIRNWRKRALEDGKVWDKTRKLYLHPRNSTLNLQGARNGPHR